MRFIKWFRQDPSKSHEYNAMIYCQYNKNKIRMQQSFRLIKCPSQQNATTVCLTHTCYSTSPFSCDVVNCKCTHLHSRCKSMKLNAFQDYLINWKKWVGKGCSEFMARVSKIYANARDKLDRQEAIFEDYCKDLFLGKHYSEVVYLIQKRQFAQLNSQLLAHSVSKITETSTPITFEGFTLSEMRKADEKIKGLMEYIEQLYKGKEVKIVETQRFSRSNSVTLQRSNSYSQKEMTKSTKIDQGPLIDIMKLKVDLSYPKLINSKIVQDATCLNKILGKKIKKYHLAYRGSESSFNIAEFYRKINVIQDKILSYFTKSNIKSQIVSVILIKTQFGKVIGGLTHLKWQENKGKDLCIDSEQDEMNPQLKYNKEKRKLSLKLKCDNIAATNIFSLDLMERYDLLKPSQAIYCGKSSIGFGTNDIRIVQKGNIHRKNYSKFPSSYNSPNQPYLAISKSGMGLIGSKYSPFFKLEEWQAFLAEY